MKHLEKFFTALPFGTFTKGGDGSQRRAWPPSGFAPPHANIEPSRWDLATQLGAIQRERMASTKLVGYIMAGSLCHLNLHLTAIVARFTGCFYGAILSAIAFSDDPKTVSEIQNGAAPPAMLANIALATAMGSWDAH